MPIDTKIYDDTNLNWINLTKKSSPVANVLVWWNGVRKWRASNARRIQDQEYWGKPVPGFGDPNARVLVVGLAPGAHGSNRTGRNFTGDASGKFLYPALYRLGLRTSRRRSQETMVSLLNDLYIAASARCAPPDNKPTPEELNNCQPYLERDLEILKPKVIVCLGRVAFERILKIYGIRNSRSSSVMARCTN